MSPMSPRLLSPRASGAFTPRSISGLLAWYDAADASTLTIATGVSAWADKSGNNHTLRQPIGNNQPASGTRTIGGRNALDFDGTNDVLSLINADGTSIFYTLGLALTRQLSMFGVCATDNASKGTQFLVGLQRSGLTTNGSGAYMARRSTTTNFETAAGDGNSNDQSASNFIRSFSDNTTASHVYSSVIDGPGNALTTEKNGVNQTLVTRFGSGSAANFLSAGSGGHTLDIGNTRTNALNAIITDGHWDGLVGEVVIYTRAVSAAERQRITRYLGAKWGIAVA